MGGYDSLTSTIQEIVLAAIDSDMALHEFGPDGSGGYVRYYGDAFGTSGEDHVPGPGQGATGSVLVRRSPPTGETFDPAGDVYAKWHTKIPPLFDAFLAMPEPMTYQSHLLWIQGCCRSLTVDSTETSSDADSGYGFFEANQALNDITTVQGIVDDFAGDTMITFKNKYIDNFEDTTRAQFHVARMLWASLAAEQQVWWDTQDDVATIAAQAVAAMKAAHPGGGGDIRALVRVVWSVAKIATLFFTGGAAAPIIKGVETAGSVLRLQTDGSEPHEKEIPLHGFVPDQVFDNLVGALEELKTLVGTQEDKIIAGLDGVYTLVTGHDASFNLAAPGVDVETDPDKIAVEKNRLYLDPKQLKLVGTTYMPELSQAIKEAAWGADPYGQSTEWDRTGGIGRGSTGPRDSYTKVSDHLHDILMQTSKELHDAGDTLLIVADNFEVGDADVAQQMREHAAAVATTPVETNTPTY